MTVVLICFYEARFASGKTGLVFLYFLIKLGSRMGTPSQLLMIHNVISALLLFQYPLFTELPKQPEHMAIAQSHGTRDIRQCVAEDALVRILKNISTKPLLAGA